MFLNLSLLLCVIVKNMLSISYRCSSSERDLTFSKTFIRYFPWEDWLFWAARKLVQQMDEKKSRTTQLQQNSSYAAVLEISCFFCFFLLDFKKSNRSMTAFLRPKSKASKARLESSYRCQAVFPEWFMFSSD